MKSKIIDAIDKGIMNALSADIEDQDIDFNHDDVDNEYVPDEYKTVDMGTGILWCEYNIGAYPGRKPEDWYGNYYAWGELDVKGEYALANYNYDGDPAKINFKNDVVCNILGNKFRMPSKQDYDELLEKTIQIFMTDYNGIQGLNGILLIAENDNRLFFPASGYYNMHTRNDIGKLGGFWINSQNLEYTDYTERAYTFNFNLENHDIGVGGCYCYFGLPVRGVKEK